jgi:hypothetical protein
MYLDGCNDAIKRLITSKPVADDTNTVTGVIIGENLMACSDSDKKN